jgi:hypothetical protein
MIDAPELARSLRVRGVALAAAEGALRFFPADALSDAERADLATHRDELVAVLEDEQDHRVRAMRAQIPADGPIPLLMVADRPHPLGRCGSCGDVLTPVERYRCGPCVRAAWTAVFPAEPTCELDRGKASGPVSPVSHAPPAIRGDAGPPSSRP